MKIAILAWGSLVWDDNWPNFDKQRGDWFTDGPILPLEFSRVSASRDGALTLVIDTLNGKDCKVMYALSKRTNPDDAIADLRDREGTIMRHIGFCFAKNLELKCVPPVPPSIPIWASSNKIELVIWAGLPSNFSDRNAVKAGTKFSVEAAVAHLQNISPKGKAAAAEYVWRAPELVVTPLRTKLQTEPWFEESK
ncbi:hypothetical protein [Rubrimonas sp.]|uniref:hypothetical protein n=1 Tax=Rubrimonas sp. TaxID=2036015 RepID=UPI002FDE400E